MAAIIGLTPLAWSGTGVTGVAAACIGRRATTMTECPNGTDRLNVGPLALKRIQHGFVVQSPTATPSDSRFTRRSWIFYASSAVTGTPRALARALIVVRDGSCSRPQACSRIHTGQSSPSREGRLAQVLRYPQPLQSRSHLSRCRHYSERSVTLCQGGRFNRHSRPGPWPRRPVSTLPWPDAGVRGIVEASKVRHWTLRKRGRR